MSLAPYFIVMISWNIWMFAGKENLFVKYPLFLCSIVGLVLGFCIVSFELKLMIDKTCNM